ncbi:MAG: hypothetical protein MI923_27620 [Phycisphaerales bacterium]|nr:hypothetical protein [Phycisphaerales bacterium]
MTPYSIPNPRFGARTQRHGAPGDSPIAEEDVHERKGTPYEAQIVLPLPLQFGEHTPPIN